MGFKVAVGSSHNPVELGVEELFSLIFESRAAASD